MKRGGFTLTELLVAIAIIVVLATLASVGAAAARTSGRANATRGLLERLNGVLLQHMAACETDTVDMAGKPAGMSANAYRAWFIRRNVIAGDMPDRWTDVAYMATPSNGWVPQSAAQSTYISIWNSLTAAQQTAVQANNASAECLFMAVMRGGIGDCLSCGGVASAGDGAPRIGDQDGDGMPEFLDAWGNPIGYLLWAPALALPANTTQRFFSGSRALDDPFASSGAIRPSLGMRPLIYSTGPDGKSGLERNNEAATLSMGSSPTGRDCGNPTGSAPGATAGGPSTDPGNPASARSDNLTNFDDEAKR